MPRSTRLEVARLEDRETPAVDLILVGSGIGVPSKVEAYDPPTGALKFAVEPFPGFTGGVSVASGDVTGDGTADVIVGAGVGGGPVVALFDGVDGTYLTTILVYEETFRGGVNVAAGDFDGDGRDDLVIGSGPGGGPRLRILNGESLLPVRDVLVYESTFRGGVNVAVGDITGDGNPDIATSPGEGGGPRVVVFNGTNLVRVASFFAFDTASRNGFNIGVGDVNADGRADIVAGAGLGEPSEVRVFSGKNLARIATFSVSNAPVPVPGLPYISADGGIRVAVSDVNGDEIGDVLTVKGPGSDPILRAYQITAVNSLTNALYPSLVQLRQQSVFDPAYGGGLSVGASDNTGNPLD